MTADTIESAFLAKIKAVPRTMWSAFLATLIGGLLIHLFAFTNMIPNSDGISRLYDLQQMTVSGRWFLHYASWFNSYTQMPMLIGVLSLLFLGAASALIVDVLKIRGVLTAACCGLLMAAVPALAYTYLYMFTASAYGFAILLAVLAVWVSERTKWGWLWGSAFLTLSMGTYQSYAALAITLSLMCVMLFALENLDKPREILICGLKKIAMLALGAALYWIILQIFLRVKDLELLEYRNMNDAAGLLSAIPKAIPQAYKDFAAYYLKQQNYVGTLIIACNVIFVCLGLLGAVMQILRAKRSVGGLAMLGGMLILLPLAVNFTYILSASSEQAPIMQYSFVLPLMLALAMAERVEKKTVHLLAICATLVLSLKYAQVDNLCYTATLQAHRATESYATRLCTRIESCPGYERGMEVAIIGRYPQGYYRSEIEAFELVNHYSCLPTTVIPLNKHIYYYLNLWLNVPIEELPEETMIAISKTEEFAAMPLYPSDGSVAIIDGRVVVKVAETYTPKKPYEIAYENRR